MPKVTTPQPSVAGTIASIGTSERAETVSSASRWTGWSGCQYESIGQPEALANRSIAACLPEQLPRIADGASPSRIMRRAVSLSYGAWTWFWRAAALTPPRRRISWTVRTWRSSPE